VVLGNTDSTDVKVVMCVRAFNLKVSHTPVWFESLSSMISLASTKLASPQAVVG
jgi:hypothetical protein